MPLFDEDTNMLLLVGKVSHPVIPKSEYDKEMTQSQTADQPIVP